VRQLVCHFALDLTASHAAQLTTLSRRNVTVIFLKIRERIAEECERESPLSNGEVEVDESYFGARRVRGKRGRGASGKTIVFGLLKREGRVYTEIVPDCKKATLECS
jgi:transposase